MAELITHDKMKFVPKSWGWELWIVNNSKYCGKILFVKQGQFLSYHFHKLKDEVLYVQSGKARFVISENADGSNPEEKFLDVGMAYHVTENCPHQIEALSDLTIIEFSTTHFDSDSYRLSPNKSEGGQRVEVAPTPHPFRDLFDGEPNCIPETRYCNA
jgi:mannose-6-phosphate isomerase-like protein (cupin superfamily)